MKIENINSNFTYLHSVLPQERYLQFISKIKISKN